MRPGQAPQGSAEGRRPTPRRPPPRPPVPAAESCFWKLSSTAGWNCLLQWIHHEHHMVCSRRGSGSAQQRAHAIAPAQQSPHDEFGPHHTGTATGSLLRVTRVSSLPQQCICRSPPHFPFTGPAQHGRGLGLSCEPVGAPSVWMSLLPQLIQVHGTPWESTHRPAPFLWVG